MLILIVGMGIPAYVTYRKAIGPPPTPPGKCREFDVLSGRGSMLLASVPSGTRPYLGDIDEDWCSCSPMMTDWR